MSLTAVAVLRPVHDATQPASSCWGSPSASLLTLYPAAREHTHFAAYCRALETAEAQHFQHNC